MQANTNHSNPLSAMNSLELRSGEPMTIGSFVRQWGPCILTALVVPGGIVIALLMLWSRWNQRRMALRTVRA